MGKARWIGSKLEDVEHEHWVGLLSTDLVALFLHLGELLGNDIAFSWHWERSAGYGLWRPLFLCSFALKSSGQDEARLKYSLQMSKGAKYGRR